MRSAITALVCCLCFHATAQAEGGSAYEPADRGMRPTSGSTRILPEQFLRGFDPITVYFTDDAGPGRGPADNGAQILRLVPFWPGAYVWVDRQTLQFRPAENWPPLARFSAEAKGAHRILTTMMSAPQEMSPPADSDNLRPFRTVKLTFPQSLSPSALKEMIHLEVRELPGLDSAPRRLLKEFSLTPLPRGTDHEPAAFNLTLPEEVPEGRMLIVSVSLALGDDGKVLWRGRLSTQTPFHLEKVQCGGSQFSAVPGGATPKEAALACGNTGAQPQLVFSAPLRETSLTDLRRLVRLEPSVPDLNFQLNRNRLAIRGKFVPDTLYRMTLASAPIADDSGRILQDPGGLAVYFHLGWSQSFIQWSQSTAMLEASGPRTLPLVGYAEARADLRIYRVDPLFAGLWPFASNPVVVKEEEPPPFPGEEPIAPATASSVGTDELRGHIRLLGSPLVSRVVDLPLAGKSGTTRFGLDVGLLLDPVVGKHRPGTYLVGLRRLSGPPERSYLRVQLTNLSLTAVEERDQVVFFVRTLDQAKPVSQAQIAIEAAREVIDPVKNTVRPVPDRIVVTTDSNGRATVSTQKNWTAVRRIYVQLGDDFLIVDPREPPPRFFANHWSSESGWLRWLGEKPPPPPNDQWLGFLFTERGIYRPGESVFVKGYVRRKVSGVMSNPGEEKGFTLEVVGPDKLSWRYPVKFTALSGFSLEFKEKDLPTGPYSVALQSGGETVARRSFQIEAYRVPTFEVQLAGAATVALDSPFKIKAVARYYAGGSVAGQPIRWTVTRRRYHHVPTGREGFLFASSNQFARDGHSRTSEPITQTASLDKTGAHEIGVNPALDLDGSARIYRFEATVTGPDNQEVTAIHEAKALAPFVVGMRLPRYSEKAFELRPEIVAIGVDDKPVSGQEVSVRLYRRVWHSSLRETQFATGEAKYVTEQEDVRLEEKVIRTGNQLTSPVFQIKQSGVYVVELFARDKLGRVQTMNADLFVGGKEAVAWKKSREGVFDLSTDKKSYRPGEVARVILQSPFQTGSALVIVEEPGANSYAWHDIAGGKAIHEVKVLASHVPNLPLHVILMRGRLGESPTQDARYKPQTLASSLNLEVETVKNQVQLQVDHPPTVRPGVKVDFTLTLKDDQDRPLAGEVTLWVVDEAVLALAREGPLDPLKDLIARNKPLSSVRDTRNTVLGRVAELEESPGGDGEEGLEGLGSGFGAGAGARPMVRKNFKTVPYYQATLLVPSSGRLAVPVQISDDLTNFRVRAVAASGMSRFGVKQTTLRVRLPVTVQPQLPRFVRQGDRFWGGARGRLVEGADGPGRVEVTVSGPIDGKPLHARTQLQKDKTEIFLSPFVARAGGPGAASIKFHAEVARTSDGAADAFEVTLPVLPDRPVEHFAYLERYKPGPVVLKPFPETPRAGTAVQKLAFSSVPGVLELVSGLEYLQGYPHGCLEQRTSQLQPELAVGGLLKRLGLESRYSTLLSKHVSRLLEDAALHQTEQGLFAFWPGGTGDIQITGQLLEFMASARKAGIPVDGKMESRAVETLKRVLRSDYLFPLADYRYNQQITAVRALARAGYLDEHYLIDLFHHRAKMDSTSVADLTRSMGFEPKLFKTNLASLRSELWASLVIKLRQGKPTFAGMSSSRSSWEGYLGSDTAALAAVFEALLSIDPSDARHEILRDALIAKSSPVHGFGSTYDNRRAIEALSTYLDKAQTPVVPTRIALAGQGELRLDESHRVIEKSVVQDSPLELTISGSEVGARVEYVYLPQTPGDQIGPLKQGFIVTRSIKRFNGEGRAIERLADKAGANRRIALGDILEIDVQVTAEENRTHVALVVPFAAGLEPMNPALENASALARPSESDTIEPAYLQRLDHEVRYYFLGLPRGTHSFHFRVRAATEGSFVQPPPYAEQMYRQDVRGRGEGLRLIVTGEHER